MIESVIHEPTIARVRRDVAEYKYQAAWLDTWSLLRMFDEVRADNDALRARLARLQSVAETARALLRTNGDEPEWAALRVALYELDGGPS